MKYKTLLVEKEKGIATVTFNRPDKLNTLNTQMFLDLRDLMLEFRSDLSTRVVVFTGAGRAFSSGFDFREEALTTRYKRKDLPNERIWQLFSHDLMISLENLEQVTIAAVNGLCIGGGMCIAINCDFRLAADHARFGVPEANLGIFLSWGITPRMTTLIGPSKTKELIMTADIIDAQEAHRLGMLYKIVPADILMASSYELSHKILAKGPLAQRITKKYVNAASVSRMANFYVLESELFERNHASPDALEGVLAALEKRTPRFQAIT